MTTGGGPPAGRHLGAGIKAGAIVGALTGICYLFVLGRVDFSRGAPLRALAGLPARGYLILAGLVLLGAAAGALVSLRTSDE